MITSEFKSTILPLSGKLLRFATYITNDEEMARDVIQDVFLKLWQKKEMLADIENMEAFAMRMTRNRCLDLFKTKRLIPTEDEELKIRNEKHKNLQLEIELSETAFIIRKLISQLPEVQQTIMHLRDIEQYDYEEISEITDMSINTIRVNLSRARKKVRDELLKQHAYESGRDQKITKKVL